MGHWPLQNNQKHGQWIRYKADGSIEKEQMFQNGIEVK